MSPKSGKTNTHKNDEKTVRCPVEGCGKEVLARGLHLHVRQSTSGNHGAQGEVPTDVDLDDAEVVGSQEVSMDYPEHREHEQVKRLCPYCKRPWTGKHGVMIHLGQLAGRKNHPEEPRKKHDLDDFPVVHVDENDNVIEVVEGDVSLPTTERRQEREESGGKQPDPNDVRAYIEDLREQGLEEEAEKAEKMLLGE